MANIKWLSATEVEKDELNKLAEKIRSRRNAMLAETDWVVIRAIETSIPVDEEISEYRQSLRDIPQQEGFPSATVWPVAPHLLSQN